MRESLAGIVLAGGKSRRLGTDKGRLALPDGRPLILSVIEALGSRCDEVVVVTDDLERYSDLALPARLATDILPGRGPLGGLHAGLRAVSAAFAFTAACDMPFLNPNLIAHMAGLPRSYQALVPRFEGRQHAAHAIYARACLPAIEDLLSESDGSLRELLARLDVRNLDEDEIRQHDPDGLSLFNLNEPQDLDRFRALSTRPRKGQPETSAEPGRVVECNVDLLSPGER